MSSLSHVLETNQIVSGSALRGSLCRCPSAWYCEQSGYSEYQFDEKIDGREQK